MGKPFESFTKKETKRNAKNAHILISLAHKQIVFIFTKYGGRGRERKREGVWGTKT